MERPSRKKSLLSAVGLAAGLLGASLGGKAAAETPNTEPQTSAGISERLLEAGPESMVAFFERTPAQLRESDIPNLARAIATSGDRASVLMLFRGLYLRAGGEPESAALVDALEPAAHLSAAEILLLHRSNFNTITDGRSPDFMLLMSQMQADPGAALMEDVFEIIRYDASLGTLDQRAHLALLVSRQLYNERVTIRDSEMGRIYGWTPPEVTPALVRGALDGLSEAERIADTVEVFNPSIYAFYGNETWGADQFRFGNESMHDSLVERSESLHEFRAQGYSTDAEGVRNRLKAMESDGAPVTLYFDTHGFVTGVYLDQSGRKSGEGYQLLAGDIADAFIRRYREHPELLAQARRHPDTIIFGNCYGGDIQKTIASILEEQGLPVPGMISASEIGQFGYSAPSHPSGSFIADALFATPRATFGDIARADKAPRDLLDREYRPLGDFMVVLPRDASGAKEPGTIARTGREVQVSENDSDTALG